MRKPFYFFLRLWGAAKLFRNIISSKSQGGKYVLHIPATLWTILIQNKRFEGIKPSPENTKPNPDGSYTVTLTTIQFKKFEENQKKPPIPVSTTPGKDISVQISVTQETSAF